MEAFLKSHTGDTTTVNEFAGTRTLTVITFVKRRK